MSTLPNSKSKILGIDDHAAALSGSVIAKLTRNQAFPAPGSGSCSGGQSSFQTIGSTGVTINHPINELYIFGQARFTLSSSNAMQVRLIRDNDEGDILASLTTGVQTGGTWALSTTIINETVGAHTYQWQIKNTQNPGETSCVYATSFYNLLSEANDTHQANLSGANTQETHEDEVLP